MKKLAEKELIKGLTPYGARADELPGTTSSVIFAFRVFCLRQRFPHPYPSFRQALEALQSDDAYLPELSGEIVAYCKDGRRIEIPTSYYIHQVRRFEDGATAKMWVLNLQKEKEDCAGDALGQLRGCAIVNPDDPVEKQIRDATTHWDPRLAPREENSRIVKEVEDWLSTQIYDNGNN